MISVLERLNKIDYKRIVWFLAVTITIHNMEEAIWLPDWSPSAAGWLPRVGAFEFRFAVTVLTLIFYGIIYYFSVKDTKLSAYLMYGLIAGMLFNVFIPHTIATISWGVNAPGAVTGILLNLPVTLYLLHRGMKEGWFDLKLFIGAGMTFGLGTLLLILVLFRIGRVISDNFI